MLSMRDKYEIVALKVELRVDLIPVSAEMVIQLKEAQAVTSAVVTQDTLHKHGTRFMVCDHDFRDIFRDVAEKIIFIDCIIDVAIFLKVLIEADFAIVEVNWDK